MDPSIVYYIYIYINTFYMLIISMEGPVIIIMWKETILGELHNIVSQFF